MVRNLPDYNYDRYVSVQSIVLGIESIKKRGDRIENNLILTDTIRKIFERHGITNIEINQDNVAEIIEKLEGLSEQEVDQENVILKESAEARDVVEEENLDSARVPTQLIRELVTEYENYLANGLNENQAISALCDRHRGVVSRKNIESVIRRQQEIYNEMVQSREVVEESRIKEDKKNKSTGIGNQILIDQGRLVDEEPEHKTEEVMDNKQDLDQGDVSNDQGKSQKDVGKPEELIRILATEQLILENKISEEVPGVDAQKVAKELVEDVLVPELKTEQKLENSKSIERVVAYNIGAAPDKQKQEDLQKIATERLTVTKTQVQIAKKTEEVTNKLINSLKADERLLKFVDINEEKVRQSVRKMATRLVDDSYLSFGTEVGLTTSEIEKVLEENTGIKLPEDLHVSVETSVKEAQVEMGSWVESKTEEVSKFQKDRLSDSIMAQAVILNPKMSEQQKEVVKDYGKLVGEVYFYKTEIVAYKREAVSVAEKQGYNSGQIDYAWKDLRGLSSILKMKPGDFKSLVDRYRNLKTKTGGINLPTGIKELNSFEGLMGLASDVPEVTNIINLTQRFVRTYNLVNKFSGGLLTRMGFEKAGMSVMNSIGGQAMTEFAKQSLMVMAENGTKKGAMAILRGILSGGVKAGAGAAKAGAGAAGAGGVAGAVAAFQAIPVAGQILLAAVALYAVGKKLLKPIEKLLKGMGIDFDKMKVFLQDTFGKFIGGMISFGIKTGTLLVGVPVFVASISFTVLVAPVVVFLFIGLMGYSLLNSNLASSLVPPIKLQQGNSTIIEEGPIDLSNLPEDCPSIWPANSGCVTQGPLTVGTHVGLQAIDIGCVAFASTIVSTHAGLAVPFHTAGCGYGVDVYSTCNGVKFRTHFCHGPYPYLTKQTQVKKGEKILVVDNTGLSFGNHIHYDLKLLGPINNYLPRKVPQGCIGLGSCGNMRISSFNE